MDNGEKLEKKIEKGIEEIESNLNKIKELNGILEHLNDKKEEV